MKRILIDARKCRSSTGRYARELIANLEALDSPNLQLRYVVHEEDKPALAELLDIESLDLIVCNAPFYSLSEQWQMWRLLRRVKPDLVHFWMPQQPLLYRGKKIATVHDLNYIHLRIYNKGVLHYEFKRAVFKLFLRIISRTNRAIIAPTQYTKDDLASYTGVDPNKVHVTHEGTAGQVNPNKTKPIQKLKGKEFLMYVGQSSKYKGQLKLIESLQELRKDRPELRLAIIGSPNDYTEKLQRVVKKKGYKGVEFLGFITDQELSWAYSNCAAFVQPSTNEGFGLMNLEAMVCGAPVVSSNATCLPEVCGDAAHYFDPKSNEDMTRAISEVISNNQLRKRLIKIGYEQANRYSWSKMAKETLSVYNLVLGEKS